MTRIPKYVFDDNLAFSIASSMAIIDDDNFMLYDYQVYGTEQRVNQGLEEDLIEIQSEFKERKEIFAVKIYGEEESVDLRDGYIYIINPDTSELNIEYYLVKDLSVSDISVPCRSFIMLFSDISTLINNIYKAVYWVILFLIITPISIKLVYIVTKLRVQYNIKTNLDLNLDKNNENTQID